MAERDWVLLGDRGGVLHAVATLDGDIDDGDDAACRPGRTACGRTGVLCIPGVLSRLGAPRCRRCCERTGMPHGAGSPVNSPGRRPVAEQ